MQPRPSSIHKKIAELGIEAAPTATYVLGITLGAGHRHGQAVGAHTDCWLISLKHYAQLWVVNGHVGEGNVSGGL